jgi:hypothetical protein
MPMLRLNRSLAACGTPALRDTLRQEIEALGAGDLPLQQGLSAGSYALDRDLRVMILAVAEEPTAIRVRAGIFFTSIIAGCSCADDPTPIDEQSEYCEVRLDIDRATGETSVGLWPDGEAAEV